MFNSYVKLPEGKTLRGSDWWLADRPLDTGLPMGRYCDLASFDGRRCVLRGTLYLILKKWFRTQKFPFLLKLDEVSCLEFRSRELFVNARIITAHLARCQFMWVVLSHPDLGWWTMTMMNSKVTDYVTYSMSVISWISHISEMGGWKNITHPHTRTHIYIYTLYIIFQYVINLRKTGWKQVRSSRSSRSSATRCFDPPQDLPSRGRAGPWGPSAERRRLGFGVPSGHATYV